LLHLYCATWGDAARFCNWLDNGQPIGSEGMATTETGAYTLNGDVTSYLENRNANARYFIPSETKQNADHLPPLGGGRPASSSLFLRLPSAQLSTSKSRDR
jgi:hypothetical protein